jgi:pSer/pThr/pTyr-binding forkhead associated (FHA) protein
MAGTNEAHLIGRGGVGFALRLGDQVIGPAGTRVAVGSADVGRLHAHVYWDGTTATLTDAGCANGTLVNGDRVVGAERLRTGDVVRVGTVELRFEEQG